MTWLVFTYSLPSGENSSTRVSLWRRLKRIGAASPKGGVFILPDRDDCLDPSNGWRRKSSNPRAKRW